MSLRSRIIIAQTQKDSWAVDILCNTEWTSAERGGKAVVQTNAALKEGVVCLSFSRGRGKSKPKWMPQTKATAWRNIQETGRYLSERGTPHHHNPPFQGGKAFWPPTRRASTTKQHPLKQSAPLSSSTSHQHGAELVHKVTKLPTRTPRIFLPWLMPTSAPRRTATLSSIFRPGFGLRDAALKGQAAAENRRGRHARCAPFFHRPGLRWLATVKLPRLLPFPLPFLCARSRDGSSCSPGCWGGPPPPASIPFNLTAGSCCCCCCCWRW